jgi:uncharacterized membrane protein
VGLFRYRTESGERKFWPLKDILRGRSVGKPTHPMFVVFPLGFLIGSLAFDILSVIGLEGAPLAATYMVLGGLVGAVFAIATGLLDRAAMRPGSLIRRVATRHMIIQSTATAIFLVELIVRWPDRRAPEADALWIVLGVIGTIAIIVGGDVGLNMVFKMGARVEARGGPPDPEAAPADAIAPSEAPAGPPPA